MVNKLTFGGFIPYIEYRGKVNRNDEQVIYNLERLQKIPDQVHKIVRENGGKIVLFEGLLTDQPECQKYKGKLVTAKNSYDYLQGLYVPKRKMAFVGVDPKIDYWIGVGEVILHEYGHCVDHLVGEALFKKFWLIPRNISDTKRFQAMHKDYREKLRAVYMAPQNLRAMETFAISFDSFYLCQNSREEFIGNFPKIAELIKNVEQRCLKRFPN